MICIQTHQSPPAETAGDDFSLSKNMFFDEERLATYCICK